MSERAATPASERGGPPAAPARGHRLARSPSTYLRQHASNPVEWYRWGPQAIARARRENRPIFVSVGYSACYWCHVANWTLYQDAQVAELMNRWFVNVKVDREERPDVDRVLLGATRRMTGSAGWPNNLFLTPGLDPILAGSYWPRDDDALGRPGFVTVLRDVHARWTRDERGVRARAAATAADIRAHASATSALALPASDSTADAAANARARAAAAAGDWAGAAREALLALADREHGGLRSPGGAKFPRTPALALLLVAPGEHARAFARATLDAMAFGATHDHLGGGFHRYALDERWNVPHFEKMLADNAQLLALYASAAAHAGDAASGRLYAGVARGIAGFMRRDLAAPGGGFFVSLDAATGRREGATYLWSEASVARVLGERDARRLLAAYELRLLGGAPDDPLADDDHHVLRIRVPIEPTLRRAGERDAAALIDALAPQREALLRERRRRVQPAPDRTLITGFNGLAIGALAAAAGPLGDAGLLDAARATARRLWRDAWDPRKRRLAHAISGGRAHGEGFLEDYALLARGLLELHAVGGEPAWRARARDLADAILARFVRADGGLASVQDEVALFMPADEAEDANHPSGPSAAIGLWRRLREARYERAAERAAAALAVRFAAAPQRWASLAAAVPRGPAANPAAAAAAPTSANRVEVDAVALREPGADRLRLTLRIVPGWHLNANPASYDFLIPTRLEVVGAEPTRVVYPRGNRYALAFVRDSIDVYVGSVQIEAEFAPGALSREGVRARLAVQACSDTLCLPPETVPVAIRTP